MPSRVIRGEINSSLSLSRVSLEADLTFRALLVAVDDYGRFKAHPAVLRATLFPMRTKVTDGMVSRWLAELVLEGCVIVYMIDGKEYLQLPAWEDHRSSQKRAGKSRFPDPPENLRGLTGKSAEIGGDPPAVGGGGGLGVGGGVGVQLAPSPADSSPAVMTFQTTGEEKTWTLTESKLAEYRDTFDTLDVLAECKRALQWIRDNPKNRKTASGMPAFLSKWMGKSVNSGPNGHANGHAPTRANIAHTARTAGRNLHPEDLAADEKLSYRNPT